MNLRLLFMTLLLGPASARAACPANPADVWQEARAQDQRGAFACALHLYEVYEGRTSDPIQRDHARRRIDELHREKVGVLELFDAHAEIAREIRAFLAGQELVRAAGLRFYYDAPGIASAQLRLVEEPARRQLYARVHSEEDFRPAPGRTTKLRYAPIEESDLRFATGMGLAYLQHLAGSTRLQPRVLWTINLEHRWKVADTRSSMDLLIQLPVTFANSDSAGVYGGAGLALGARGVIHLPGSLAQNLAPVFLISYQFLRQPSDPAAAVDPRDQTPICTAEACTNPALRAHFLLSYAFCPLPHQELRVELGVDFGVIASQLYPPHLSIGLSHLWRFPRRHDAR